MNVCCCSQKKIGRKKKLKEEHTLTHKTQEKVEKRKEKYMAIDKEEEKAVFTVMHVINTKLTGRMVREGEMIRMKEREGKILSGCNTVAGGIEPLFFFRYLSIKGVAQSCKAILSRS